MYIADVCCGRFLRSIAGAVFCPPMLHAPHYHTLIIFRGFFPPSPQHISLIFFVTACSSPPRSYVIGAAAGGGGGVQVVHAVLHEVKKGRQEAFSLHPGQYITLSKSVLRAVLNLLPGPIDVIVCTVRSSLFGSLICYPEFDVFVERGGGGGVGAEGDPNIVSLLQDVTAGVFGRRKMEHFDWHQPYHCTISRNPDWNMAFLFRFFVRER